MQFSEESMMEKDGTEIAALMRYFKTADPDDMSQGDLSERIRYLKCDERGEPEMCEVSNLIFMEGKNEGIEEGRAKGMAEGKIKGELAVRRSSAVRMHALGLQDSVIAASLDASVAEVQSWIAEGSIPA